MWRSIEIRQVRVTDTVGQIKLVTCNGHDMHVAIQPVMSMSSSGHKTGIVMYSGNGDANHSCDVTGPPCMWRSSLSSPRFAHSNVWYGA